MQALNSVPIEFYGKKKILDKWEEYYDHLGDKDSPPALWMSKRLDIFVELMGLMAASLGYRFNVSEVKKIYHPAAYTDIENDQHEIRLNVLRLLRGEQSLQLAIKEFPISDEAIRSQAAVQAAVLKSYSPDGALRVEVSSRDQAPS